MTEAIIVSIVTGIFTLSGVIITVAASNHKRDIEEAKKEQKLNDRLDAIETKLDIHNGYAEKLGDITIALTSLAKDVEYLKKRG